jgi:hypothetical protein
MPRKKYTISKNETLTIEWDRGWQNMFIHLNGLAVGQIQTKEEGDAGRDFRLKDGSLLHIQRKKEALGNDRFLEVELNGVPIAGSEGDPKEQLYGVAGIILILALGNITMGICSYFFDYVKPIMGINNLVFGGVFLVLAVLVAVIDSYFLMGLTVAIFLINAAVFLDKLYLAYHVFYSRLLVFVIIILIALIRGFYSIKKLRKLGLGFEAF